MLQRVQNHTLASDETSQQTHQVGLDEFAYELAELTLEIHNLLPLQKVATQEVEECASFLRQVPAQNLDQAPEVVKILLTTATEAVDSLSSKTDWLHIIRELALMLEQSSRIEQGGLSPTLLQNAIGTFIESLDDLIYVMNEYWFATSDVVDILGGSPLSPRE